MIPTRIIRGFVLLTTVNCVVKAQSVDTTATPPTTHIRVGGGTMWGDGGVGLVGFDWQPAHSRLGIRATIDYSRRTTRFFNPSPLTGLPMSPVECTNLCVDRVRRTLEGVSLDARYDLLTGAFRPYVFSGFGLYRSVDTQFLNAKCGDFSCSLTPGVLNEQRRELVHGAMQAGVGASVRIKGRFELYGEASWRALSGGSSLSNSTWGGPTTIGFRF